MGFLSDLFNTMGLTISRFLFFVVLSLALHGAMGFFLLDARSYFKNHSIPFSSELSDENLQNVSFKPNPSVVDSPLKAHLVKKRKDFTPNDHHLVSLNETKKKIKTKKPIKKLSEKKLKSNRQLKKSKKSLPLSSVALKNKPVVEEKKEDKKNSDKAFFVENVKDSKLKKKVNKKEVAEKKINKKKEVKKEKNPEAQKIKEKLVKKPVVKEELVVKKLVAKEPAMKKSTTKKPTKATNITKSATKEPAIKKLTTKEPIKKPVVKNPAIKTPLAQEVLLRDYKLLKQKEGNPVPFYPKQALEKKWEGDVGLVYYVNSNGLVDKIRIDRSSGHSVLDNSAIRTLSRYRYHSGQEGWVRHSVKFVLDKHQKIKEVSSLRTFDSIK